MAFLGGEGRERAPSARECLDSHFSPRGVREGSAVSVPSPQRGASHGAADGRSGRHGREEQGRAPVGQGHRPGGGCLHRGEGRVLRPGLPGSLQRGGDLDGDDIQLRLDKGQLQKASLGEVLEASDRFDVSPDTLAEARMDSARFQDHDKYDLSSSEEKDREVEASRPIGFDPNAPTHY